MTIFNLVGNRVKELSLSPEEINLAIDEIETVIKNYCNIDAVPVELTYTAANMAVDLLRGRNAVNTGVLLGVEKATAISTGDTSVSVTVDKNVGGHTVNLDNLIQNYGAQLKKFRRVKW